MKSLNIIQSSDPDVDTLKCPKCGALWRSRGHYNYDEGGWVHDEDYCPNDCVNFFGFEIKGKVILRDNSKL